MKNEIFIVIILMSFTTSFAQQSVNNVLSKMADKYDQYDRKFNPHNFDNKLVIVYISGRNNPFSRIYDRHKGINIKENVQFIGGFRETIPGMPARKKREHLQQAFLVRYGKKHFPILLDLESEIAEMLSIKGNSIIIISKKDDKILSVDDFGDDRIQFFKSLSKYIN